MVVAVVATEDQLYVEVTGPEASNDVLESEVKRDGHKGSTYQF